MKKAIHIVLASALITTGILKAAPALAQVPAQETNISLVRTADLDLNSASGQRTLDQRLANAAREVCGSASDLDLEGKNAVRKCRDDTLAQVRSDRDVIVAAAARDAFVAVTASR